ncbi:(2Fe-2S)-binding protein [Sediminicoccus sp. KRV36]|uniref:(2Fe-2S)-binding protein n=1 Tax=Sediminicoccus sp. KRV36 TaxID=3133721 RepID=UPI00200F86FA|nr:(2Fe-2S)-binding protein [Sediminicoccus rosea]UPY38558.1 (2Fe-2S)-binding protein [Sediminicoccus rosea]
MTRFTLNGVAVEHAADGTLLQALRGEFALNGPRFGCGAEACGACHVLLDGRSVPACALPMEAVAGRDVITLEGLGTRAAPHPLQTALLEEQAGQCGFCLSGIIVTAAAFLRENPAPDEAALRVALDGHLCRCGSHNRILRAIMKAAEEMRA